MSISKIKIRKGSWIICIAAIFAIFLPQKIEAATYTVDSASDIFFEISENQRFTARADAARYGIDSMLWLYREVNNNGTIESNLITANDDYFGLDSYLDIELAPGNYRLRTGVCCGDPNRWYGSSYTVDTNLEGIFNGPTTTSTTTTTTTTTTIPAYLNPPRNLRISSYTDNSVSLEWDAPLSSNTEVERYAIFWSCDNWRTGYAISSLTTDATINNLNSGTTCEFKVRSDNDTQSVYSSFTEVISATTNTTTTTTSTTTTTTVLETTTTTVENTIPLVPTTVPIVETTTTTVATTTIPPVAVQTTTTSTSIPATTIPTTTTTIPPTTTIPVTTTTVVEIKEDMTQNELIKAVANPEVLKTITEEQAKEVFQSIDVSEITDQEKDAIIEAIQEAPVEVKEAFEEEINIYSAGFEDYVPLGSEITVSERRTLIAVASITTAMSLATSPGTSPSGGSGGSSGGPSGNSNSKSPSGSNSAFKKEEEPEEDGDEAPEIEGPEGGDEENYTKNSIYKYTEDGMKRFSLWGFIKKFSRETAALAFTISSTVIVFATLSGDTRKITLIATSAAFLVHYISVMLKNDE